MPSRIIAVSLLLLLSLSETIVALALPHARNDKVTKNSNSNFGHAKRQDAAFSEIISASTVADLLPFSFFASAAYCDPIDTFIWDCGDLCDSVDDFIPTASGGDGDTTPFWYVGYWPDENTIIVAHQGTTDPSAFEASLLSDDLELEALDPTLFPGLSDTIQVNSGFAATHALSAEDILNAVQATLAAHTDPAPSAINCIGHSLGGALALLDLVYINMQLKSLMPNLVLGPGLFAYGLPRVGNQAFVDFLGTLITTITHINNAEDPIPLLPPTSLGYHHPTLEFHIQDDGSWAVCPGEDNPSTLCSAGDVPNISEGNIADHMGPYNGVIMGCGS